LRFHKLAMLGCAMVLALIVAACDTDDVDDIVPGIGDDDDTEMVEDTTPTVDDEVADDAVTTDDEAIDDATPAPTDDHDITTEQETALVTIEEDSITMEHHAAGLNGVGDDAMVEDDDDAILGDDDDATMEDDDDAAMEDDEDAMTDDDAALEDDETEPGMTDQIVFMSGNILFDVTNNRDEEVTLEIVRADDHMNGVMDDDENGVMDDDDAVVDDEDDATMEDDDNGILDDDDDAVVDDQDDATMTDDDAMMNGEAVEEMDDPVGAGESTEWEVNLEAGEYILYVLVDGERAFGMEVRFSVQDNGMNGMNGVEDDIEDDDAIDTDLDDEDDGILDDDEDEDDEQ
jgi:hypothetical protein